MTLQTPLLRLNPCQSCGACCATFRVDFHPAELAGGAFAWGDGVPVEMVECLLPQLMRMKGTDAQPPRCIALQGVIGEAVACGIYAGRPSPCREFDVEHAACNQARRHCGLPALE